MTVMRIVEGLERSEAEGRAAQDAARLGFLEWVFTQPGQIDAGEIRAAQAELSACGVSSAAACAFADVLRQAVPGVQTPGRRGGRYARRMI